MNHAALMKCYFESHSWHQHLTTVLWRIQLTNGKSILIYFFGLPWSSGPIQKISCPLLGVIRMCDVVKYVFYVWVNEAWYFPLGHTGRLMKGSQQNTDPLFMQPSLHHKQQIKCMHNAKLNLSWHKEPVPWGALGKGVCIGYFITTFSSLDPMTLF